MASSEYILTVDSASFEQTVIEQSHTLPVLVDFWADWCAPCRMLAPILERIAEEYQGQIRVTKVNTESEPQLAQAQGIRSLPTVRLYKLGQMVEEFLGVRPEAEIRAILDSHVMRAGDRSLADAISAIATGEEEQAIALLQQTLADEPDNENAILMLCRLYLDRREYDEAEPLIQKLGKGFGDNPELHELRARWTFACLTRQAPSREILAQSVANDENNHSARYQLAAQLVMDGEYEDALEHLLFIVARDRSFEDDGARNAVLAIFELLGGRGPLVNRYRARMASLLN